MNDGVVFSIPVYFSGVIQNSREPPSAHRLDTHRNHDNLAILCDLFGMVKRPFQRLSEFK